VDVPDERGEEMKDTIYREDAIKAINLRARIPHDVVSAQYASMAINAIRSVPPADRPSADKEYLTKLIQEAVYDGEACAKLLGLVDRSQGKWVKDENGDYRCSECGGCEEQFIYGTENWYGRGESKFCPSCGARMKGADNE